MKKYAINILVILFLLTPFTLFANGYHANNDTIKVLQYIGLSYFYIMIIKHTDFYCLVISIQICFHLVGSMLLELINKISFRLKHIFLIFCAFPESRIAEYPLDFLLSSSSI